MTRDEVLDLCAALPGATEDYPFGEGVAGPFPASESDYDLDATSAQQTMGS